MNKKGTPKNLRPWKKGDPSPNPGGAPKGKRVSTWLAEIGDSTEMPDDITFNARIAKSMICIALESDKDSSSVAAANLIIERTEGKLDSTLHLKGDVLAGMSEEQKKKAAKDFADNGA